MGNGACSCREGLGRKEAGGERNEQGLETGGVQLLKGLVGGYLC